MLSSPIPPPRRSHCCDASLSSVPRRSLLLATHPTVDYLASTNYPTQVPHWVQISRGLWSDGSVTLPSSAHPKVQTFLTTARSTLQLPQGPSDILFTLAALEVFYRPNDPAHWLFWSDDKKAHSAEIVNRIALHHPPLIRSRVAWNGVQEYLAILAIHHGPAWRQLYESQPWFSRVVPPKPPAFAKLPNLRKRKVAPGAFREASHSPLGPEERELPEDREPKRAKVSHPTRRPAAVEAGVDELSGSRKNATVDDTSDSTPTGTPALSRERKLVENTRLMRSTAGHLQQQSRLQKERQDSDIQQKSHRESSTSMSSSSLSSTSPATSILLSSELPDSTSPSLVTSTSTTKLTLSPLPLPHQPLPSTSSGSHARNRSTSQASAETLVRRSLSVLSSETVVEQEGTGANKDKPIDKLMVTKETIMQEGTPDDAEGDAKTNVSSESVGMVTRGKASKATGKTKPGARARGAGKVKKSRSTC